MRRILSILLLLVLGLGSDAPATALATGLLSGLASGWSGKVDESRLPACCRRNGKHHCAMASISMGSTATQGESTETGGEATLSANNPCPFMPHAMASTAPSIAAILPSASDSWAIPSEPHVHHGNIADGKLNDRRGWPKRGPPSLQIL